MEEAGKKEFNGVWIYIGEGIYLWRNSQHERLWWQPEWFSPRPHLLLSLQSPSSWFSSRSDPLISLHPLLRSSVSSCTKPSVIPSATETVTDRYSFRSLPGNSNHYDALVNSNRRANTDAARTTHEISTPAAPPTSSWIIRNILSALLSCFPSGNRLISAAGKIQGDTLYCL